MPFGSTTAASAHETAKVPVPKAAAAQTEWLAEAQQALDCAVLLEPSATGPYILLGQVPPKCRDAATAIGYLLRAEKPNPGNHLTQLLLSQTYRSAGRKEDTTREYNTVEAIQNAPEDHD